MRLLHPETIRIIIEEPVDFSNATVSQKTVISHAWSEVFKYLKTKQAHPKMFIDSCGLGSYLKYVYEMSLKIGCNFNDKLIKKYSAEVKMGFSNTDVKLKDLLEKLYFDDQYLFSDAVSLYLKGANIFPNIFGEKWRKYVPIENLLEIQRIVNKTLDKKIKKI